jgi:hypothetical protein
MLYLILLDPSKEHYSFQAQHFRHHQICLKFLNLHQTYIDIHQFKHIKIMQKNKLSLTFGKFSKHLSSHMKGFMHRNCSIEHQKGTWIKKGTVRELTLSVKWHGRFSYSGYKQLPKAPSTETQTINEVQSMAIS